MLKPLESNVQLKLVEQWGPMPEISGSKPAINIYFQGNCAKTLKLSAINA